MRLKELNLIQYGKFDERNLSFPAASADFHVIVGPNEAGKSTVRSAVSELLFGMKHLTPLGYLHGTNELRLGGTLEGEAGTAVFHRARGRSGTLRGPGDEKLPEDFLAPFLGGVTREIFEQMFALDHERLIQGGRSILDASDKLGQVLFESAAGVGSLGPVRQSLEARAAEIWGPRRTNSEFARAEAAFGQAVADLKSAQVRTRDWQKRKEALEEVDAEIDRVRKQLLALEVQRTTLERVRRLAPFLQDLASKEATLAELGNVVAMPADALEQLLTAQRDIATAKGVLDERVAHLVAKREERGRLTPDEPAVGLADDIQKLDKLRGSCVNHPRDLPLRQAELAGLMRDVVDAASQLGWPTNESSLRAVLPKALALKTVTHLLRERGVVEQALDNAKDALEEKRQALHELEARLDALTTTSVPQTLRLALSEAQAFRNDAAKVRALERSISADRARVEESLDALGRWRMPVDELRRLNLPSTARLSALQKQQSDCESAVGAARKAASQARAEADRLSLEERHFTQSNKVVTGAEVHAARVRRDAAWSEVRSGAVSLATGAPVVDGAMRLADELVDSQISTAQQAAELQSLRQRCESAAADAAREQAECTERESALASFRIAWSELASSAGVPGMALDDMSAWLARRDTVFAAQASLETANEALEELQAAGRTTRAELLAALQEVALGTQGDNLAALIATAEEHVQSAERIATQRRSLAEQLRQSGLGVTAVEKNVTAAREALDLWKAQWQSALRAAGLEAAATTPAAAEGAVELVASIHASLAEARDPGNRIAAMQADLEELREQGQRLARQLDSGLVRLEDPFEVARRLATRLSGARETGKAIDRADDDIRKAQQKVEDARTTITEAEARVRPLLALAGVASLQECIPLAERSARHQALASDIETTRAKLVRGGDGLSLEQVADEIREHDMAQVAALHETTKQSLAEVHDNLTGLLQRQVVVRQEFESIHGQANAAVAEARRQEALAAMGEAAEQYIEATSAQRLLKWATDRYRDQKQGPMLQRATAIFARLTLGEFSRLAVDAEKNPPELYARRSAGPAVGVAGLSEGTRDQLFFALRLAALELQFAGRNALPFIADDLFVNFDDARSEAGFRALEELSTKTQVLFLTHHDHLLPIIEKVFGGGVNIVALERNAVPA